VTVLFGNGSGGFTKRTDLWMWNGSSRDLAIRDVDGGFPDLVVATDGATVMHGNGDGSLGTKRFFAAGPVPGSLAIGDLNGDGWPELVTANVGSNTVSVLINQWTGFEPKQDFPTGWYPTSVAIGDLNGDGLPDLAVASSPSYKVSVLLNTSSDGPVPTLVELFRAVPTAQGIRVEWRLSDPGAFQSVEVHRGTSETGPWSRIEQAPRVQGDVSAVLDEEPPAGAMVWYRLSGVQSNGHALTLGVTSVMAQAALTTFALAPLSPNPSAGRSLVSFAVPARARVRLTIADVQGREVARLADGIREAGHWTAALDATDLHPGLYFVRMQAPGVSLTRRLVVVK
jgi:hypothetical protein